MKNRSLLHVTSNEPQSQIPCNLSLIWWSFSRKMCSISSDSFFLSLFWFIFDNQCTFCDVDSESHIVIHKNYNLILCRWFFFFRCLSQHQSNFWFFFSYFYVQFMFLFCFTNDPTHSETINNLCIEQQFRIRTNSHTFRSH